MIEKLKKILSNVEAEFADIRYEKKDESTVSFDNHDLHQIGNNSSDGYVIRVLKNGGFSSISFNSIDDAPKAIKTAIENATLLGKRLKKPVILAKSEVIKDSYNPPLTEDPEKISIEEKYDIIKRYNDLALANPEISSTTFHIFDLIRNRFYVNTEGTEISEKLVTTGVSGILRAKKGNILQNVRVSCGGSDGFKNVRNQEEYVESRVKIAVDLLNAKPVEGGVYNVILNQSLAGVFTHEAFGHFSEADLIEDAKVMRERMKLGNKLGNDILNIQDDPTIPHQLGFYKYDDEGVAAAKVQLMKNGILTGRLHSRRTAAEFGEPINGHCIAEDYRYAPIIRMGTIFIEPGESTFEQLISKLGDGLYLCDAKGGQTAGENFTFGAQYGYLVKNGKIDSMIKDINIAGNLYDTLKNIVAIGNDLELCKNGGCGKGQLNIRSCHGAPHILIEKLVVGGR